MKKYLTKYGFRETLSLIVDVARTRIFFSKSRLIRFPLDIRNKAFIDLGMRLTTGRYCRIEAYPQNQKNPILIFGDNVQLNDFVHITAMEKVVIGNNVLMASKIYISDSSHGFYSGLDSDSSPEIVPIQREYSTKPVVIEDNVWIGESVSILPGVTIGKGSVIGANSVVSKTIPENVIAVGIPAKPIKKYNFLTQKWEKIDYNEQ